MWAFAEVLILEDDDFDRAQLVRMVEDAGMYPIECSEPGKAYRLLAKKQPVLAIIDRQLDKVPATDNKTVEDVLKRLRTERADCIPLVYSANVETIDEQAWIYSIHPWALFVSKKQGPGVLKQRIDHLLGARFADLAIQNGKVIHLPSGKGYPHRVGCALLISKRAGKPIPFNDSDARAARRFGSFLLKVNSPVRVRALKDRLYELELRERVEEPVIEEDA